MRNYWILPLLLLVIGCGEKESTQTKETKLDRLDLVLSKKAEAKLNEQLKELEKAEGNVGWVKGELLVNEEKVAVKVKRKASTGEKIYVKADGDDYIFGLKEFALRNAAGVKDINEWLLHQFLKQEDVLETTIRFCQFSINGEVKGNYVLEEGFTKLLVESRKRREGPIVAYTNQEANEIKGFGMKKIKKSEVLSGQFEIAKTLLQQNTLQQIEPSQIFDLSKLAKYFATKDLFGANGKNTAETQRWYFNGVTGLVEPIGYNELSENMVEEGGFYGKIAGNKLKFQNANSAVLRDSLFHKKYLAKLNNGFNETYINDFFLEINRNIKLFTTELNITNTDEIISKDVLLKNLKAIQQDISSNNYRELYGAIQKQANTKEVILTPAQRLQAEGLTNATNIVKKGEKIILSGKQVLTQNLVIPKGYKFVIEPGTSIDLQQESKIISYSPISAEGTETNPINIFSSDKTGNGFTVLLADEPSKLDWVNFNDMNTLNYEGWVLTGAVTFYESDVTVNNCQFNNNVCEDGLNIVRSQFTVSNSTFNGSFSDAFDGDFCVGKVDGCIFTEIGNDAIDFSGSEIEVTNCGMNGVGDKGISIGENSTVKATNVAIKGAVLGISAKDLSKGKVENLALEGCDYGFAIYQKKAEFGPGSAICKNVVFKDVKQRYILDLDSKIELNDSLFIGDKKIDIDALFY